MGDLGFTVDINEVKPAEVDENPTFTSLEKGWYPADIISCDVRENNAGTGSMVVVNYALTGEVGAGRRFYHYINFRHQNPDVQKRGEEELSALTKAVGLTKMRDTDQAVGNSVEIFLARVKEKNEEYKHKADDDGFKNVVKGVRKPTGGAQGFPTQQQPVTQAQQTRAPSHGGGFAPWEGK